MEFDPVGTINSKGMRVKDIWGDEKQYLATPRPGVLGAENRYR